jgi:hypothetical protein
MMMITIWRNRIKNTMAMNIDDLVTFSNISNSSSIFRAFRKLNSCKKTNKLNMKV